MIRKVAYLRLFNWKLVPMLLPVPVATKSNNEVCSRDHIFRRRFDDNQRSFGSSQICRRCLFRRRPLDERLQWVLVLWRQRNLHGSDLPEALSSWWEVASRLQPLRVWQQRERHVHGPDLSRRQGMHSWRRLARRTLRNVLVQPRRRSTMYLAAVPHINWVTNTCWRREQWKLIVVTVVLKLSALEGGHSANFRASSAPFGDRRLIDSIKRRPNNEICCDLGISFCEFSCGWGCAMWKGKSAM